MPLLSTVLLLAPAPAPPVAPPLQFEGGSHEDRATADAAFALRPGEVLDPERLDLGLRAIRATDRFQAVEGRLLPQGSALVHLTPWPRTERIEFQGLPEGMTRWIPAEFREGATLGDARLQSGLDLLVARLRSLGYPSAQAAFRREEGGRRLVLAVSPGRPRLIQEVRVKGPMPEGQVRALADLKPGVTLWTESLEQALGLRFRRTFLRQQRLEGHLLLQWQEEGGILTLEARPGPIVELAVEGKGIRTRSLRKVLPLSRADRYTPDLAGEGDRRLQRLLLGKGHLEAQVTHRREVLSGPGDAPERVRLTYLLKAGPAYRIEGIDLEGAREISTQELLREVTLPRTWPLLGAPAATPERVAGLKAQLLEAYRRRGHADAEVAALPPGRGTTPTRPAFRVLQEGERRLLQALELDVPRTLQAPWPLAQGLAVFLDPRAGAGAPPGPLDISAHGGRPAAHLEEISAPEGFRRFRLRLERPVPLLNGDLIRVLGQLRQLRRMLGIQRPQERRLEWVEPAAERTLRIELADQPVQTVRRIVYRGADHTAHEALARETLLRPGRPLDPDALARTQGGVASLGGFSRVDLLSLKDERPEEGWQDGDLLVRLLEGSPWIFSTGFGYDKSQGYHGTFGVQRLNLNGMGRVLDFGVRAGDATLQIPALRRLFPTGSAPRSVDMFTLGYTDPFFAPGFLKPWLPERSTFRSEAAYVEELRDTYLVRKRRWQNSLEWSPTPGQTLQAGLRYERVKVVSAIEGITDDELNATARMPAQATISAPYVQFTRDRRDNPFDPTQGTLFVARVELANQLFGTSPNSSFVKIDLRQQWNWALGEQGTWGVASLGLRLGAARPTDHSSRQLPLSERFFAGGPFTHRGVEPDWLGPQGLLPVRSTTYPYDPVLDEQGRPKTRQIPVGGQGLYLANLEWRFPTFWNILWGEVFVDSGMVIKTLRRDPSSDPQEPNAPSPYAPRTALGLGVILKVGIPLKVEWARDLKRILRRPRSQSERDSELRGFLISAGFQF